MVNPLGDPSNPLFAAAGTAAAAGAGIGAAAGAGGNPLFDSQHSAHSGYYEFAVPVEDAAGVGEGPPSSNPLFNVSPAAGVAAAGGSQHAGPGANPLYDSHHSAFSVPDSPAGQQYGGAAGAAGGSMAEPAANPLFGGMDPAAEPTWPGANPIYDSHHSALSVPDSPAGQQYGEVAAGQEPAGSSAVAADAASNPLFGGGAAAAAAAPQAQVSWGEG